MNSMKKVALIMSPCGSSHLFVDTLEHPITSRMLSVGFWMVIWWIAGCVRNLLMPIAIVMRLAPVPSPNLGRHRFDIQ